MERLEDTFQKIARVVATRYDIQVRVQGAMAGVDLDRGVILLPSVSESRVARVEDIMDGYLDHEIAHVKYSDMAVHTEAKEQPYYRLWNLFEDVYVERKISLDLPGCGVNIRHMNTVLYDDAVAHWEKIQPTGQIMSLALMSMSGQDITRLTLPPQMLPLWERFKAQGFIERGKVTQSSVECLTLAKELYEFFKTEELAGDLSKKTEKCGGAKGEKAEAGAKEESDAGDADFEDDEDSDDEDSGGVGAPQRILNAGATAREEYDYAFEKELESTPDADQLFADWLGVNAEPMSRKEPKTYTVFSQEWDTEYEYGLEERRAYSSRYQRLRDVSRAYLGSMAARLELALMARTQSYWAGGQNSGKRYDKRRLMPWVCGLGNDAIYQARVEGEHLDTAVSLLWDCSGSMQTGAGSKSELAAIAAAAFHEALLAVNIPHEVLGFNTNIETPDALEEAWQQAHAAGDDGWRYSRLDAIDKLMVFVPFGQADGRAIAAICGEGENRDAEAVLWAARRLVRRPERRLVLIVGSDGEPSGARYRQLEATYLRDVVSRVIKSGIEIYGLGIQSAAVQNYYPTYTVVNKVADIPQALITTLASSLQNQKGKNHEIRTNRRQKDTIRG